MKMKNNLICVMTLIAFSGSFVTLEAQEKSPKAEYSLRPIKQTVIVGEPILAELVVNNEKGKESLMLDVTDVNELGTLKIMDLQGKPVRSLRPVFSKAYLKSLPRQNMVSVATGPYINLGKKVAVPFVANRDWTIRQPGKYRIRFLINVPNSVFA